jgi:hypothetical protein
MTRRRTLYLPVMIAATVAVACAVALSAVPQKKAEATFHGKNGRYKRRGDCTVWYHHPPDPTQREARQEVRIDMKTMLLAVLCCS